MPDTRDAVFDRILVDHLVRGGTRVSWSLFYQFECADPGPYTFQLETAPHAVLDADDWADVGGPLVDTFSAVDPDRELPGGTNPLTHYRLQLTTPLGNYTSAAAGTYGLLGKHDWLAIREMLRKEQLRFKNWAGTTGELLKRRRQGQPLDPVAAADPRTMIVDPLTDEIIRRVGPPALPTWGAEFLSGYYRPVPVAIDIETAGLYEQVDDQSRGNVDDDTTNQSGRAVLFPPIAHRDLFITDGGDLRYEIGKIKILGKMRGVPILGQVELRQIQFRDILYGLDPATL
jgi:hypothetical protein